MELKSVNGRPRFFGVFCSKLRLWGHCSTEKLESLGGATLRYHLKPRGNVNTEALDSQHCQTMAKWRMLRCKRWFRIKLCNSEYTCIWKCIIKVRALYTVSRKNCTLYVFAITAECRLISTIFETVTSE